MPRRWRQRGPFVALGPGRYALILDVSEQRVLANLLADMVDTIDDADRPEMRRLFPTAYPNDPERDAEYQSLMRSELHSSHHAAAHQALGTLGVVDPDSPGIDDHSSDTPRELNESDLAAWTRTLNAARLMLGTKLDVSEDTDPADGLFINPGPRDPGPPRLADTPDAAARFTYLWLSELLESAVSAASRNL